MTSPTPDNLATVNRRRRRLRLGLLIGFAPLALVALLLTVKLLSMVVFAHQAIVSHLGLNPAGTIAAAEGQRPVNVFEPYKAPYNLGVGLAAGSQLPQSRAAFEEALGLASGLEVCAIRVNLALVITWMGDDARNAGELNTAQLLYREALNIAVTTPEECRTPEANEASPDPNRDLGEALDELQDDLQQKMQGAPEPETDQPDDTPPGPDPEDLQDLEDLLQNGAEEREDLIDNDDGGVGSGADRPW